MSIMARISKFLIVLFSLLALTQNANAEDEHLGLTEFEVACKSCHGLDGMGDGDQAKKLKNAPPNLTQIAKQNGGVFPYKKLEEYIDGRTRVKAHGIGEMPVWGNRYRVAAEVGESSKEIDERARQRIRALVHYIATIQEP